MKGLVGAFLLFWPLIMAIALLIVYTPMAFLTMVGAMIAVAVIIASGIRGISLLQEWDGER